jgi:excisionase family DNA binding protein
MESTDVHLLRPAEVIDMLGVSRSWLYDAAKSGRIPCVRLGGPDGPVRFRRRELEAWIDQGSSTVPADPAGRSGRRPGVPTSPAREPVQLRFLPD